MPSIYKTCCFTGHREISDKEMVLNKIYDEILKLYKNGTVNFISGMAKGFDMLAARQVIALRSKYSDVQLIGLYMYLNLIKEALCLSATDTWSIIPT